MLEFERTQQPHTAYSTSAMAIEHSRNMESRDHSNGVSPKNQSRGNIFLSVNRRRTLNFFICGILLLGMTSVFAQGGTTGPLTWNLSDGTLTISGNGAMPNYMWNGAPWYPYRASIHTVVMKNGVTTIGSYAFEGHPNLSSVSIPSSITSISQESFRDCVNLTTINCNNPVPPSIGYLSFEGVNQPSCNLYVPLGSYCAYSNSGFSNFNIIEKDEWSILCVVFTNVETDVLNKITNTQYDEICSLYVDDFERFVENAVPSLDLKITTIQHEDIVMASKNASGHYTLPPNSAMYSILDGYNYKNYDDVIVAADLTLQENTFGGVGVGFHWPGQHYSAVMLLPQTFSHGYLVELFYHEWMHSLEWWFSQLGYTVPNLHDSESYGYNIHDWQWYHAYLSNTLIGNPTGIHPDWWKYSPTPKLKQWEIGKDNPPDVIATFNNGTLTIQGEGEMQDFIENEQPWFCVKGEITTVIIEKNVTTIGAYAFVGLENLVSVTIPNSVTDIGEWAFAHCYALPSINIPDLIIIKDYVFDNCKGLEYINIPNSVISIGSHAFKNTALTTVYIPVKVANIGNYAFEGCNKLTDVHVKWAIPLSVPDYTFLSVDTEYVNLHVPCESEGLYKTTPIWKDFKIAQYWGIGTPNAPDVIATFNNGTLTIQGEGKMQDFIENEQPWFCVKGEITTVIIEKNVTTIGAYAFVGHENLVSVTIPNSVTDIGEWAFAHCYALPSIIIPDLITINNYVFDNCKGLKYINIPNSVTSIGSHAFKNTALTTVYIPVKVASIGNYAFEGCNKLTDVHVKWAIPLSVPDYTFLSVDTEYVNLHVPCESEGLYKTTPIWKDFKIVCEVEGIAEVAHESNLIIYPNPASEELTIVSNELQVKSIEIYDVMGRKALTSPVSFPSPETTLNLAHLPTGVYFLKIQTENGVVVRKVVKK